MCAQFDAVYLRKAVSIARLATQRPAEAAYRITRFVEIEDAYYQNILLKLFIDMFRIAIKENDKDIMNAESDDITFDELLRGF